MPAAGVRAGQKDLPASVILTEVSGERKQAGGVQEDFFVEYRWQNDVTVNLHEQELCGEALRRNSQ